MQSLFASGQSKTAEQNGNSFDIGSFVGGIAGSSQKSNSAASKKDGVESLLDVSTQNQQRKFIPKTTAKPASKSSNADAGKSRDSKDHEYSSQRGRDGHSEGSKAYKKEGDHNKPRDSSRDYRDSERSRTSKNSGQDDKGHKKSNYEDYNPLSSKSREEKGGHDRSYGNLDSFDVPIKKKTGESQDVKNGENSPKIKKVQSAQPPSPKIKKVEPSPLKKPEVQSSNPKANPPSTTKPSGNSSVNKISSSQGPSKDQRSSSQKLDRPDKTSGSIPKKPMNGPSQSSSKLPPAKPTSSSPGPSKSMASKPLANGSLSSKPSSLSKPVPGKPSMSPSMSKSSSQRPGSNSSMSPRPPVKAGSINPSKPSSQQSTKRTEFAAPMPKPSSARPVSSQSPKPVAPAKAVNGAMSKEAMRKQMEAKERMRREAAAKGRRPEEPSKMVKPGSNLVKRPLDRPGSKFEPELQKKPKLTAQERNLAFNSIFKGKAKPSRRHRRDSDDDDYDENDSFIDDGEADEEAMEELGKIFKGYRRKVQQTKHIEDDIDDMEVGFDRIQAEDKWTEEVGKMEDEREFALIKKELEEEAQQVKKKRKPLIL